MVIGIDASRAFLKRRTGIEEYSYQVIKHLRSVIVPTDTVILYVRKKLTTDNLRLTTQIPEIDFELPSNWKVRGIWAPRFWTQIGLSLEMLFHSPDVLFVPAHTVPLIHPKKTIVTVHGLEYEFCPESYSFLDRVYMRLSIRHSCHGGSTVICVSENTKRDIISIYNVDEGKITVVYEGYSMAEKVTYNQELVTRGMQKTEKRGAPITSYQLPVTIPYLLFIGRLEERKNIVRMIEAFEILKEKYNIPHQLVLVGKPGYGYARIEQKVASSKVKNEIREMGYVTEEEKWGLLQDADVFLFPSLYEGFGIPVLEAQSMGVPVVTANTSSLPEIAGAGAVFIDPLSGESIAEGMYQVLSDKGLRDGIIAKGLENVKRFSWQKCAEEVALLIKY